MKRGLHKAGDFCRGHGSKSQSHQSGGSRGDFGGKFRHLGSKGGGGHGPGSKKPEKRTWAQKIARLFAVKRKVEAARELKANKLRRRM